jgi:hypothetical protein
MRVAAGFIGKIAPQQQFCVIITQNCRNNLPYLRPGQYERYYGYHAAAVKNCPRLIFNTINNARLAEPRKIILY